MTFATLDYKDIRQAVLQLPQWQRLQLIKDAILTLSVNEQLPSPGFDFDTTLKDLQRAFAEADEFTDQETDDARYVYLMEKHSA